MDDKMNEKQTSNQNTAHCYWSGQLCKENESKVFQHNQYWWSRCEGFDVIFMGMNMKCWESVLASVNLSLWGLNEGF